jgi:hypothetical protein
MAFESYSSSTNFVGKDGFHWWIGQIEKTDKYNKNSNRYKVRIVGHHLKPCELQDTDDLPWAQCIAPVTDPFTPGSPVTTQMECGTWVIGFFMDAEMAQQPFILGTIGSVNNTVTSDQIPFAKFEGADPEGCRAFTNFATQVNSAYLGASRDKKSLTALASGVAPGSTAAPGSNPTNEGPGQPSTATYVLSPSSPLNPGGSPCVVISQAECPTGKTASKLEIILSELFAVISQSGGGLGGSLTSKITGYAMQGQSFVMGYIQKALSVIMQGYGWLKGELYYYVQLGVQKLLGTLLSLISDKGKPKNAKPPFDPKKPRKLLDQIQLFLEKQLAKIGCSIENLYDRILDYLTKLIFKFVDQIWNSAFCAIDALVNNAMNAIQKFLTDMINAIMGPLQSILGAIADPLNVIGGSLKAVFDFLGISCSGLPKECKKLIVDCGEGPQKQKKADALDRLLADIAATGKPFPPSGVCKEATDPPSPEPPDIVITGGIPVTPTPRGPGDGDGVIDPGQPTNPTQTGSPPTLSILVDPSSVVLDVGQQATFSVVASSSDNSVITYQWERSNPNGTTWTSISGANSSSYNVSSVSVAEDGVGYRCVVTGTNTSPASLTSDIGYVFVNTPTTGNPGIPNSYNVFSEGIITFTSSVNYSFKDAESNRTSNFYSNTELDGVYTIRIVGDSNSFYTQSPSAPSSTTVTYRLTVTPLVAKADDFVTITLITEGVPNGTSLNYLIFGVNLQPSDFIDNTLVGSFVVLDNKATAIKAVSSDVSFPEDELVYVALENGAAATNFVIKGSQVYADPTPDPADPIVPVACDPIISDTGKIISIPICSNGTQYLAPPSVFIQSNGFGYGASAVAKLDGDGFLSEIRVVRPGRGYPPAPPTDNLDCIITGFTIIKPGFGYDEEPIVYVDGDPNVAIAVVENGLVTEIKVRDKTRTFRDNPTIKIIASSRGVGAIAVANINCLDREDVRSLAEVVGPTPVGRYVDCP